MADTPPTPWQERFPPVRPGRSYMMDVSPEDVTPLPDLRRLLRSVAQVAPLEVVLPEDWEPWPEGEQAVAPGMVLEHFLTVDTLEVNAGGRTPCSEQHLMVIAAAGVEPDSPVVVCPLLIPQQEYAPRPGLIPILLPRAEYNTQPRVVLSLLRPEAVLYRHVAATEAPLRLQAKLIPRLQSALRQVVGD